MIYKFSSPSAVGAGLTRRATGGRRKEGGRGLGPRTVRV